MERVKDAKLPKGKTVVEEEGSAPTRTTATREIYSADGELIRSETWTTRYEGETRVVRVGTKVVEPEKPKDDEAAGDGASGDDDDGYDADDASAVAIASTSQSGTRVGRDVSRSTTACFE